MLIGGEVRTQNMDNPEPHEPRVKICIYAKVIAVMIHQLIHRTKSSCAGIFARIHG